MEILTPILVFILGACFGSFANVVIYRWPKEQSVIKPRSRCPNCLTPIKSYQNIPILSWLILKGKCASCSAPISISYPLIELLTAVLFLIIYLNTGPTLITLNMLIFTALAVPCFFIDLKHMYLPDIMTIPGIVAALVISIFNDNPGWVDSIIGALVGGGLLWFLAFTYKKWRGIDGMGGGDIKLLAWLGALFGFFAVPFILLLSSVAGTVIGSYFLIFQNKDSKTFAIPFGPFLITAAYIFYFLKYSLYWF